MIVCNPKEFINDQGVRFILPFDNLESDDGPYQIIEFVSKVVVLFLCPRRPPCRSPQHHLL